MLMCLPRLYKVAVAAARPPRLRHRHHNIAREDAFFPNVMPASKLGARHDSLPSFLKATGRNLDDDGGGDIEPSTLVILTNERRREILLGKKLRGFGAGKYNGFGGRLEPIDDTPAHGARRELFEEANISVPADALSSVGTLSFSFEDDSQRMEVNLFHVDVQFGEDAASTNAIPNPKNEGDSGVVIDPSEVRGCDEIVPQWFPWSEIPLRQMFADDSVWLTYFLGRLHSRKVGDNSPIRLSGWFHFGPGGDGANRIHHYFLDTD